MTYLIDVPGAAQGDLVTAAVHGTVLSVTWNGRELSRNEYQLTCDHGRETAGCPACVERVEMLGLAERLDRIADGVDMQPPRGTWRIDTETNAVLPKECERPTFGP